MNNSLRLAILDKLVLKENKVYRKTSYGLKPLPVDGEYVETKVNGMKLRASIASICYLLQTGTWNTSARKRCSSRSYDLENLTVGTKSTVRVLHSESDSKTKIIWTDGKKRRQKTFNAFEHESITKCISGLGDCNIKRQFI